MHFFYIHNTVCFKMAYFNSGLKRKMAKVEKVSESEIGDGEI